MRWPDWKRSIRSHKSTGSAPAGAGRDRVALLFGLATLLGAVALFFASSGMQVLMPGPLASVHGGIEKCSTCHSSSGDSKVSWLRGLARSEPHADSKACLTCHKMADTAFNAHGASADVLKQSTTRLMKIAVNQTAPSSARAQNSAFPTHDMVASGLNCASCHQEHQGVKFGLAKISNEQCRSCHVVKFDSFDGQHPKFDAYPFKQRTRIVFDHAGHFGKHYPEVAKKEPNKRIPATCSTCHDSRDDKRVMAVLPFEKTCSGCHRDQITGKERATGPKGIAFLSVPGLDVDTLKTKKAEIGEWPDASEAALTPFMKVMIGRDDGKRAMLKIIDGVNLQDLSKASDEQIKAVTQLAWEVKGLFYALIKGKASDALGDLNIGGGAKLSPGLVADLTASIPRDVVISAQQEWLPNLGQEMAGREAAGKPKQSGWGTVGSESKLAATASPEELFGPDAARDLPTRRGEIRTAQAEAPSDKPDGEGASHDAAKDGRVELPSGTPRSIRQSADPDSEDKGSKADGDKEAGGDAKGKPAATTSDGNATGTGSEAKAKPDAAGGSTPALPPANDADQSDDLLNPTEDELRALKTGGDGEKAEGAAKPDTPASSESEAKESAASSSAPAASNPEPSAVKAAPVVSIGSDVDPESWAEYGGWYRQDFAIFYRPTGHKDKFIYSWLFLTGPQAPRDTVGPAAAVFNSLTGKDAQGTCTKCHSIDDLPGKGRLVNFSPTSIESKRGRFTSFIHEPHFGIMENRGCLTCHKLEKDRPYLKSYEQGHPKTFASNFGAVDKDLCKGCHNSTMARQDCSLCHKYHVNGVVTPIIETKLPIQ